MTAFLSAILSALVVSLIVVSIGFLVFCVAKLRNLKKFHNYMVEVVLDRSSPLYLRVDIDATYRNWDRSFPWNYDFRSMIVTYND